MTLMTLKETAKYLRISDMTCYRMVQAGSIPAAKIGGTWKIHQERLDSIIHKEFGAKLDSGRSRCTKTRKKTKYIK